MNWNYVSSKEIKSNIDALAINTIESILFDAIDKRGESQYTQIIGIVSFVREIRKNMMEVEE